MIRALRHALSTGLLTGLLLGLSAALAAPALASEEDEARARELYENGAILYEEGRYEDAIVAWEEAWRLSQRPLLLYNIANAEERLGRYKEALDHLNRYRAFATAEERDVLDRRIANLERRLSETGNTGNTGTTGNVSGNTGNTGTTGNTGNTGNVTVPPPAKRSPLPYVLLGVGGAGAISGGIFAGLAGGARGEAGELCVESGGSVWCPGGAADALQRDRTGSLIADISFGVAIAGVAGGVLTLVLPQQTGLNVGILPGGGFLQLSGGF